MAETFRQISSRFQVKSRPRPGRTLRAEPLTLLQPGFLGDPRLRRRPAFPPVLLCAVMAVRVLVPAELAAMLNLHHQALQIIVMILIVSHSSSYLGLSEEPTRAAFVLVGGDPCPLHTYVQVFDTTRHHCAGVCVLFDLAMGWKNLFVKMAAEIEIGHHWAYQSIVAQAPCPLFASSEHPLNSQSLC